MALPCTNLNLNLYRVFYTVAKTKSFSESSRVLHISQPAISKHIQNLEYELNTILFYRNNRGIELTPEAKNLLAYVEKAYNYLMLGERELEEHKEENKGKISIGISNSINSLYLNNQLKQFTQNHPDILIKIISGQEAKLIEEFNQHNLDFIIITDELKSSNKEIKVTELSNEKYCFAISNTYPNIKDIKSIKNIEELSNLPILLPTQDTKSRKTLDNYLNIKGISINPIMELENTEMIINYTKESLGIGYMYENELLSNNKLEIIPLEDNLPTDNINLIYNETIISSSSQLFINEISE